MSINSSKIISYYSAFPRPKEKLKNDVPVVVISGEIPLDELVMNLIKKHNEVISKMNGGIKAVAFNILYSDDLRLVDICEAYNQHTTAIENILRANGFSTALLANTSHLSKWFMGGNYKAGFNISKAINIKYLIISKKGINKKKLSMDKIYFYNHLEILMTNKLSFDKLLEESITNRANTMIKWEGEPLYPSLNIKHLDY